MLYGTIESDGFAFAVIRADSNRNLKNRNKLYMIGDYVNGYRIDDINEKKIVLFDEDLKENYEVFLNDGKKDRTPVKTVIKTETPGYKNKTKVRTRKPMQAQTSAMLKKRLQRSVNILKSRKSPLVLKQAERDIKKIERMMMGMSSDDVRAIVELKKELERLKN